VTLHRGSRVSSAPSKILGGKQKIVVVLLGKKWSFDWIALAVAGSFSLPLGVVGVDPSHYHFAAGLASAKTADSRVGNVGEEQQV